MKRISKFVVKRLIQAKPFRGRYRMARWIGRFCTGEPITTDLGITLSAYTSDRTNWFALTGAYDEMLFGRISGLPRGSAFIDIGANQGIFSIIAAKAIGDDGIVVAFEPQREIARRLQTNLLLNNVRNAIIFEAGVGLATEIVGFSSLDHHSGGGHIDRSSENKVFLISPPDMIGVLRSVISNRPITIKIDVEGAEIQVLEALKDVFESFDVCACIVEVDQELLSRFDGSEDKIYNIMESYSFYPTTGKRGEKHYDELFERQKK